MTFIRCYRARTVGLSGAPGGRALQRPAERVASCILLAALVILVAARESAAGTAGPEKACSGAAVASTGYPAGPLLKKLGYKGTTLQKEPQEGQESPALKEVRELEELLFPTPPVAAKITNILSVISGIFAGVKGADPEEINNEDLAWLSGLSKPDIPFQWRTKVVRFLKKFKDDKSWRSVLKSWFEKKELYGPMIRGELQCRGMPADLEYVAMIESGYDPEATSSAGAAGIWQFMPSTGKAYGLAQSSWMDQRRSPELSTVAALDYLADLKIRLGSWYLVLASYNAGYGIVLNAVKKFNTNDYWRLSEIEGALPWETTNYVPKIIAAAVAGRNPKEFGLEDLKASEPVSYNIAQVPIPVHLSLVAKSAGISVEELRLMNPELKKNRVPVDALPYPIRIPASVDMDAFDKAFEKSCEGYKPVELYEVKFGDTLGRIAFAAKTAVKELRELNEFEKNEKIVAGTQILVPKAVKKEKEEGKKEKKVVVVPARKIEKGKKKRVFYEVIKGDTLTEIAQYFKMSLGELLMANDLDLQAVIVPGMILQVFVDPSFDVGSAVLLREEDVQVYEAGSKEHLEYLQEREGKKRAVYKAGEGETLKDIAKKFKVNVSILQAVNKMTSTKVLKGGEEIILYVTPAVYKKHFSGEKEKEEEKEAEKQTEGEGTAAEPSGKAVKTPPAQPEAGEKPGEEGEAKEKEDEGVEVEDVAPAGAGADAPPPAP